MEEEKRRMDQIEADRRLAVSRGGREGGREGGRGEGGRREEEDCVITSPTGGVVETR